MKSKFLTIVFGIATCLQAQAMDIDFSCLQTLDVGDGIARSGTKPFTLSADGNNSKLFSIFAGKDQNNKYLLSLHQTTILCALSDCSTTAGLNYTLSLVRVVDEVEHAQRLSNPKEVKVKGKTSNTIEFTKYADNSPMTSYYFKDGAIVRGSTKLPDSISIDYKVSNGLLKKKQKVKFECKILGIE